MKAKTIERELNALTNLYEKKDAAQFSASLHPSFLWSSFSKEVMAEDFKTFSEIQIKMRPLQMEMRPDVTLAQVTWEGIRKGDPLTASVRQSGNALFVFSVEEPPRLVEIRGENPFGLFQKK
ncbi:MAG: hypothetical protein AAB035_06400 [Nitrospirota bacterium]